jgi:hypothetical protein
VQRLVALFLVGLLLACPFLCRADEVGCCANRHEETEAPCDDSKSPPPSANDPVSCICAGAIKGPNSRLPELGKAGLDLVPTLSLPSTDFLFPAILYPSRDGAPPGTARVGPAYLYLLLQNFRC